MITSVSNNYSGHKELMLKQAGFQITKVTQKPELDNGIPEVWVTKIDPVTQTISLLVRRIGS